MRMEVSTPYMVDQTAGLYHNVLPDTMMYLILMQGLAQLDRDCTHD